MAERVNATTKLTETLQILDSDSDVQREHMPAFFIGHGSPMNAIEDNAFTRGWKAAFEGVPRPRAIVVISAHWLTRGTFVTAMEQPPTIHDFQFDSKELNEAQYPAQGSPLLASEISRISHTQSIGLDEAWGLDHGSWQILRHVYPDASIPTLELSIDYHKPAEWHYQLGRELAALRQQGILVIGSGNIVHNLRLIDFRRPEGGFDWAIEADRIVTDKIRNGDHAGLCDYRRLGRAVDMAIPTPDHYLPLLYVLGMQGPRDELTLFNSEPAYGSLTMTSLRLDTEAN